MYYQFENLTIGLNTLTAGFKLHLIVLVLRSSDIPLFTSTFRNTQVSFSNILVFATKRFKESIFMASQGHVKRKTAMNVIVLLTVCYFGFEGVI